MPSRTGAAATGRVAAAREALPPGSSTVTLSSAESGRVVSGARGSSTGSVPRPCASSAATSKVKRSGANTSSSSPNTKPGRFGKGESRRATRRSSAAPVSPAPGAP